MKITSADNYSYKTSFKGYDARKFRCLMFTDFNYFKVAEEIDAIKDKTGLQIAFPILKMKLFEKYYRPLVQKGHISWAQDYITVTPKNKILMETDKAHKKILGLISKHLCKRYDLSAIKSKPHIKGGNFFFVNHNGHEELLAGKRIEDMDLEKLKKLYGVEKIHILPHMDYHLDLAIRPLDDGKVLVCDDDLTIAGMREGIEKIDNYLKVNNLADEENEQMSKLSEYLGDSIKYLEDMRENSPYPKERTAEMVESLIKAGFEPIPVPGRYYQLMNVLTQDGLSCNLRHLNNFVNAIASKKDGKIVYITNNSLTDDVFGITDEVERKIGFSFKKMFTDSVAPYIDKENIHFISSEATQDMFLRFGGLHCAVSEIP